jgi:Rod binding domain-containing protein
MTIATGEWRPATGGGPAASGGVSPLANRDVPSAAKDKARKASQDFEAMFLEQTLERVFSSSGTEGPLGDNGTGGAVYRSMLVKEYAGALTKSGGIGIADHVYREMMKIQEAAHAQRG